MLVHGKAMGAILNLSGTRVEQAGQQGLGLGPVRKSGRDGGEDRISIGCSAVCFRWWYDFKVFLFSPMFYLLMQQFIIIFPSPAKSTIITRRPNRSVRRSLLALPLVLLAACGGGGGGGGSGDGQSTGGGPCFNSPVTGTCLTRTDFQETAQDITQQERVENRRLINQLGPEAANALRWTSDAINADQAAAHLLLTHGTSFLDEDVTIGLIDSGIHERHETFDYVSVTEEFLSGAVDEAPGKTSHGTAVSSVAVGNFVQLPPGSPMFNIDVKMFAIPLGDSSNPYVPITLNQLSAADFENAELYRYVLSHDLDVLNLSIGYNGGIETYTEQDLRNNYGRTIEALEQHGSSDKTILVWAAGNAGNRSDASSSPEILPGLVARIDELQGHSIAVVSTREDGTISDFSNRCGIAKDFCIAAPGEQVLTAISLGAHRYGLWSGTSLAAPMVSGGLLLMKKLFRDQLTNEELVARLFDTAKDDGMYSNSAIYGHGLMDLGAATNPWGIPEFMDTTVSETSGASVTSSVVTLGAPLGDGLTQALSSQEIAAFDALGAPFWFEASHFTVPASGASVASRLQRFLNPIQLRSLPDAWQFNLRENVSATEIGHLALTDGASRFTVEAPQGVAATVFQKPQDLEGLTLAWTPTNFDALTIEAGYLNERHSLLGSQAKGAFGHLSGETLFLGAELNTTAGSWQLAAQGELGQVNPSVGQSRLIDTVSSLSTSAFRLQATRPFANGSTLSFSLSQPLRVERGFADFSLPTGRTQDGRVLSRVLSAPLAPSGRQLDLTAKLELPWLGGDLSMGATSSSQPRHQSKAAPEWTVFTGYRSTW